MHEKLTNFPGILAINKRSQFITMLSLKLQDNKISCRVSTSIADTLIVTTAMEKYYFTDKVTREQRHHR